MEPNTSSQQSSGAGRNDFSSTGQGNAASTAHNAVNSVASSAQQAASSVQPAINRAVDAAHSTVDSAKQAADSAANWASEKGASLQEAGEKFMDDTCEYIAAEPLKSIGIALAVGIILGKAVL